MAESSDVRKSDEEQIEMDTSPRSSARGRIGEKRGAESSKRRRRDKRKQGEDSSDESSEERRRKRRKRARSSKGKKKLAALKERVDAMEKLLIHTPAQKPAVANAGVIGLLAFGFTAILSGYTLAGAVVKGDGIIMVWGFWIGGIMQLISGIWEINNGVLFGAWAFSFFGCNQLAHATFTFLELLKIIEKPSQDALLGKTIWLIFFVTMLFIISFRISGFHIPLVGTVLVALFCEAVGIYYPTWMKAAGAFYIMSGILAFWLSFTQVLNEYWRANVLPWWPYIHAKEDHRKGSAHPYFPKVDDHLNHDNGGYKTGLKKKED